MAHTLPVVGITLGDVAGIGPEVVAKALQHDEVYDICRPLIIGDARVFRHPQFAAEGLDFRRVSAPTDVDDSPSTIALLDLGNVNPAEIRMGQISEKAGRAAVEYVLKATELAMAGVIDAIATAPLNKEAMRKAGYHYIGHTEILAEVTESDQVTTMLATPGLRVTHVTRHIPFREIADRITKARVLKTIRITDEGMRDLGYDAPRLAVAALNPHNGEGGLLGREEIEEIAPAVDAACEQGIDAYGPLPADSVFFQAIDGEYDAVVTQYHDQGHIAVKTHGFEESITITLGLPIVRTSADHGTAFDIAGKGVADESSIVAAIIEAGRIAQRRLRRTSG